MGTKLKVLLVILVVFIALVVIAAAFSSQLPQTPAGDPGANEEVTLVDKPASQLVLTLSDMEAGWVLVSEGEENLTADGFSDGYERVLGRVESEFTTRAVYTTAWTFDSIENATAYYEGYAQNVMTEFSTEVRSFGDAALYWEETGDYIHMLIRKSNAVWFVTLFREGSFFWDPTIDSVASAVVSKA